MCATTRSKLADHLAPFMPSRHFTDSRTTNFYYSFLFLPPEKRRAIEAVYYFARHGDDAADDQPDPAVASSAIAGYRTLLDRCYAGGAPADPPALQALAVAIRRFNIPRQPFDDLLLGLEMDWEMDHAGRRYETFEELDVYCYRVASTIGLIAIEIFGYQNLQTREYAVNLGKALQMVNILRDVHADAQRGRIYLPAEDLRRFGVEGQSLAGDGSNERFVSLMRFESGRARAFFSCARRLLPREDRRSMKAAEIMGAIYWGLLRQIERRPFSVFGDRITLSRPAKFWTALTVYLGAEWQR